MHSLHATPGFSTKDPPDNKISVVAASISSMQSLGLTLPPLKCLTDSFQFFFF
jgi:hypothetical protein